MGKFHVRDNLFFERDADGSVEITCPDGTFLVIDASSWASVVASVSAQGETGESYRAALDFHNAPR